MNPYVLTAKLSEAQLCIIEGDKERAKELTTEVYHEIDNVDPVPPLTLGVADESGEAHTGVSEGS